ncbi:MAG: orotidine-5'-phosphate decarboxylase [Christensenellaceae bacterium]|jgi:orotidine-5'-phosphate decarboxylase
MIDVLIDKIRQTECPVCVGLDTKLDYIPESFLAGSKDDLLGYAAENIFRFNQAVIDEVAGIVPSVKVQSAYYEMYGYKGVKAFRDTIRYAKEKGLVVIADIKRNDIGATAQAYSAAYLGRTAVGKKEVPVFDADFVTLNAYLGIDGIKPFVEDCKAYGKGAFILVKTSNQSSDELQDLVSGDKAVYEHMAGFVAKWGHSLIGKNGYSSIGAVVGATYPQQAERIRQKYPHVFFLIPGYGAQGGSAEALAVNFDRNGLGGIVNNSRGILLAYKSDKYVNMPFEKAAKQAAIDMKNDIKNAFFANGIAY